MRMRRYWLGWMWVFFAGCTQPISLDLESGEPQLVVEAEMSNMLESYVVKLSTTADFRGISDRSIAFEADVRIIEVTTGDELELFEVFPGEYYSFGTGFQGEVGGQYRLRIVLTDGRTYESEVVEIPEPVEILSSEARLNEQRFLDENLIEKVAYFQDLIVELDNTEEEHFVIFDNRGFVESFIRYPTCGGFDPDNQNPPAGRPQCWAYRDPISTDIVIASNSNIGGNSYEALAISIPFNSRGRYVVDLEAKAMQSQSFNFWQQVTDQLDKGDGIFDAPFAPILGNMFNVEDPDEVVLGYFNAYAKSTTTLCFEWPAIGTFSTPLVACETLCVDFHAPATFDLPIVDQLCP